MFASHRHRRHAKRKLIELILYIANEYRQRSVPLTRPLLAHILWTVDTKAHIEQEKAVTNWPYVAVSNSITPYNFSYILHQMKKQRWMKLTPIRKARKDNYYQRNPHYGNTTSHIVQ